MTAITGILLKRKEYQANPAFGGLWNIPPVSMDEWISRHGRYPKLNLSKAGCNASQLQVRLLDYLGITVDEGRDPDCNGMKNPISQDNPVAVANLSAPITRSMKKRSVCWIN
jgi:hypothetical protein